MRLRNNYNLKVSNQYGKSADFGAGFSKSILNDYFARTLEVIAEEDAKKENEDNSSALRKRNNLPKSVAGEPRGVVELYFVNDAQIRKINAKYRDINKATDVVSLSYIQHEDFPQDNVAGEIFISVDTAIKQAEEDHHTLSDELLFLFVHGVLHIFGYDHETEKDRLEMFSLQEKIIASV